MGKNYICQLSGGKMLVFKDGWVGVEATGYPLPDCQMVIAGCLCSGQRDVLRALFGYYIEDISAFASFSSGIEPMTFDDFKFKVMSEDIGGGCPQRLKSVIRGVRVEGLTLNQALFKYVLPVGCVDSACVLPSDAELVSEYADMLAIDWSVHVHSPDWKFRNNILLFTGCREVTNKHIEFVKDVVAICMPEVERGRYKYVSGITLSNGNGAVVLTDSYIGNSDVSFLYQKVTSADLSSGRIICSVEEDGSMGAQFEYEAGRGKRRAMPIVHGVVKRYELR